MQLADMKSDRENIFLSVHQSKKNFTYMKLLGSYYTEENVRTHLEKKRYKTKAPKHLSKETRLYINISTYVTTGSWEEFERWAKLNNLLNYEDIQQPISDAENPVKAADQRIEKISAKLGTQRLIQKHCDSYRLCRKVIEDCKSAKNPKAYRTKRQTEYQLHDSLKKELQDLGVTKIPSSKKIQKRIENLESK